MVNSLNMGKQEGRLADISSVFKMRSLVGQYSFMVLRGAAMTNRPQVSLSSFVMVIILFVSYN